MNLVLSHSQSTQYTTVNKDYDFNQLLGIQTQYACTKQRL